MAVALLTREGINKFFDVWKAFSKTQMYIYLDSHPMIAIKIGDAKEIGAEKL